MDGEWRVSGGAPASGSRRKSGKKAAQSTDFAEATSFSVLEDMDEGAGFVAPRPRRHAEKKQAEAQSEPKRAMTKARARAEELAALNRPDKHSRKAGKAAKVSTRGVKNGVFVGEVVVLRKSAAELEKERRAAAEAAAEKVRAEKKQAAAAAAAKKKKKEEQEKAEQPDKKEEEKRKKRAKRASDAPRPVQRRVLEVADVARMVDALEGSGTEPRYKLLAVCLELGTPARVADAAAVHARLAAWVARCDADDVAGFFRARIECLARDAPRADMQVAPGECALLRAVAATSPAAVARALLAHRDVLQRSRGLLAYAALLMRVLAPTAPRLARTAWAAYAGSGAASHSAAAAELLADTAAALCEAADPADPDADDTLADAAAVAAHVPAAIEALADAPARLHTAGARVLDVRGLCAPARGVPPECVDALLACVARHTAAGDACAAPACAAVVQAAALQPGRVFAALAERAGRDTAAVAAVTRSIALTRAVDWLPPKPLAAYVAKLAAEIDRLRDKGKRDVLSAALEELRLTIADPDRNKVAVKKEEEIATKEEEGDDVKEAVDEEAVKGEDDEEEGDDDEEEDGEEDNDDDDEDEEDEEDEESEEEVETKTVAKRKDEDSSCLTIYAIVVALLALVFAGIGTYVVLHCTEYPQCSKWLDVVCPRVRPLCENLELPYTFKP